MPAQKPPKVTRARELRQSQTPYEAVLWQLLRSHHMEGHHWRRQHPIGPYFADFACIKARLVVELDGDSHDDRHDADVHRDQTLQQHGWKTLRFANRDLMRSPESVWQAILMELEARITGAI